GWILEDDEEEEEEEDPEMEEEMEEENDNDDDAEVINPYEENYTTHDLELGAVVFALRLWRHYLYRTKCTVYTDHKILQYILDQKELNMRERRWIELLSDFDCEIRYHPESKGQRTNKG
ncbi:putative reverse transcriptase domain-containing protein, partial [Tanacetum coccineum]